MNTTCPICSSEFSGHERAIYCSLRCREKAARARRRARDPQTSAHAQPIARAGVLTEEEIQRRLMATRQLERQAERQDEDTAALYNILNREQKDE